MIDLILAITIGIAITVASILVPLMVALLLPVATFVTVVAVVWFFIRLYREDDDERGDPEP